MVSAAAATSRTVADAGGLHGTAASAAGAARTHTGQGADQVEAKAHTDAVAPSLSAVRVAASDKSRASAALSVVSPQVGIPSGCFAGAQFYDGGAYSCFFPTGEHLYVCDTKADGA